jgi:hypothetical protein
MGVSFNSIVIFHLKVYKGGYFREGYILKGKNECIMYITGNKKIKLTPTKITK